VLVCEEGVFGESGSIVGYAARHAPPERALEPEDPIERAEAMAVERWLDVEFGPDTRRWIYFHMEQQKDLIRKYNPTGVPAWERLMFPLALPLVGAAVRRVLDITPETTAVSERRVWEVFEQIAERLSDGRRFLVGDRFSRADLTFAALAGAVLAPPQYGTLLPQPDELEPSVADQILAFRAHPAGAFAMRIWETDRR
jgi:glutathione S-transferase